MDVLYLDYKQYMDKMDIYFLDVSYNFERKGTQCLSALSAF